MIGFGDKMRTHLVTQSRDKSKYRKFRHIRDLPKYDRVSLLDDLLNVLWEVQENHHATLTKLLNSIKQSLQLTKFEKMENTILISYAFMISLRAI